MITRNPIKMKGGWVWLLEDGRTLGPFAGQAEAVRVGKRERAGLIKKDEMAKLLAKSPAGDVPAGKPEAPTRKGSGKKKKGGKKKAAAGKRKPKAPKK